MPDVSRREQAIRNLLAKSPYAPPSMLAELRAMADAAIDEYEALAGDSPLLTDEEWADLAVICRMYGALSAAWKEPETVRRRKLCDRIIRVAS